MTHSTKVLIADDHPLLLKGLADLISDQNGFEVIKRAVNGLEALDYILSNEPAIAILDIDMPILKGNEVAKKAIENGSATRIILLTFHKEEDLYKEARELGVHGYLLKEFAVDEVMECLAEVREGNRYYSKSLLENLESGSNTDFSILTPTELKVVKLIARERTSKEIANMMFVSLKTIENHRNNISRKLELEPKNNSLLAWALSHKADLL